MRKILISNGIINKNTIVKISDRVRDSAEISVMKCEESGVIFLPSDKHVNDDYYINKNKYEYWGVTDWNESLSHTEVDDIRRKDQFIDLIKNKKLLDYGCGNGGFLKLVKGISDISDGVELQSDILKILNENNLNVKSDIGYFTDDSYDLITLFHVLEHLINPIEHLIKIKPKLNEGGKIIVEVPHANDFLIKKCDNDKFKNFTFWSEHLILHTKNSLHKFLTVSGYKNIEILPYQRYPLSNHLYWLSQGKPNGHKIWDDFNDKVLDTHYSDQLKKLNLTDTLIAIAEK